MPRPGPRPYECIRRAWHSDSHQSIRGALIQEIFRVVNELHSTSTRRKKEWQEKLPIVVLRAEEILYSKANSESEYAGVDTLRTRLDDAVNTMIRRDDCEEEGAYLAPCVEAALSLGCTPKKIPRGQRQYASRFVPNGGKRNSMVAPNYNSGYRGVQHSQVQDQGFSTALPMANPNLYSVAGPPQGPVACYASNEGFVFPQNFTLPTSFEASHPIITPCLPQLGGLVQFLKSTDPSGQAGHLGPVPCPMQINVNYDTMVPPYADPLSGSRAQMDAHFVCSDLNGSICTTSTMSCPALSMSRQPTLEIGRDGCREHELPVVNALAGVVTTSEDILAQKSFISMDTRMTPQMQEIAPRPDMFSKNTQMQEIASEPDISCMNTGMEGFSTDQNGCQTCPASKLTAFVSLLSSYRASPSQKISESSLFGTGDVSHTCVDDLQLRLGPPGNEATSTSVLTGDPTAPKRSRVDHGNLGPNRDKFQSCNLPLSQQLTWSR